jgi:dual specificity MAP kinase phosphatase
MWLHSHEWPVQWERFEMCNMSAATEVSANVWQGPTPDYLLRQGPCELAHGSTFDLLIEASELASLPAPRLLVELDKRIEEGPQRLEFPSSGTFVAPSDNNQDVEDLINTVRWIYSITHPEEPEHATDVDGDIAMVSLARKPRRVLIHCPDGYTESTLLAIAYFMFAEGVPAHEAWLRLHCEKERNFFAYPCDVNFLRGIQGRLLQGSPAARALSLCRRPDPVWFKRCDGSLPSRILPYMYLGNLAHANNKDMLWELGIRRILSIGEPVTWSAAQEAEFGPDTKLLVTGVQDNGIDPLTQEFQECLEFIREFLVLPRGSEIAADRILFQGQGSMTTRPLWFTVVLGFRDQQPFASPRSWKASAYLLRGHSELVLFQSLLDANIGYSCFVRARRLNVIIQPHLRFV